MEIAAKNLALVFLLFGEITANKAMFHLNVIEVIVILFSILYSYVVTISISEIGPMLRTCMLTSIKVEGPAQNMLYCMNVNESYASTLCICYTANFLKCLLARKPYL